MSVAATSWAYSQTVGSSSAKFVLIALADYCDAKHCAWPSIQTLCDKTEFDRKTVIKNLHLLEKAGFLVDTGERKGATASIPIYRIPVDEAVPKTELVPKTGQLKQSQISVKQSQISHQPVLKEPLEPSPDAHAHVHAHTRANLAKGSNGQHGPDEWLEKLRGIYTWVDFDREIAKAQVYLDLPRCQGRKFTRTFFTRWLNRIDRPIELKDINPPKSVVL